MATSGGEEVNGIVIDLGSQTCKVGYSGEDTPKFVFPSQIGATYAGTEAMDDGTSRRTFHVGSNALFAPTDGMEVGSPFRDGVYEDWEMVESLYRHAFSDRLRCNPAEYPVMLTEPSFHPKASREKVVELMFEKFGVPAVFLGKSHALTCFSMARQTSLVIDCGYETTSIVAVHDGYVLQKSVVKTPLAGKHLSGALRSALESEGTKIRPRYEFGRVQVDGKWVVKDKVVPNVTSSYRDYAIEQVVQDVKESVCKVAEFPMDLNERPGLTGTTYELPDGQEIEVIDDRHKIPECFFQPVLLNRYQGYEDYKMPDGSALQSLPRLAAQCANLCDPDLRRELFQGVILAGGCSMFPGFRERLEKELQELMPSMLGGGAKVKVISPSNVVERKYAAWIGGSILASLGAFQQMWMSRQEYDEQGAGMIHRRAP